MQELTLIYRITASEKRLVLFDILLSLSKKLPFTYPHMLIKTIDRDGSTILDIGCGKGGIMTLINKERHLEPIGIDILPAYLQYCKSNNTHKELILCDLNSLPFTNKSVDIVLCCEVIEHLPKDQGEKLLDEIERITSNRIIVTTPVGFKEEDETEENYYQRHRSGWFPSEFRSRGYIVRGQGFRLQSVLLRKKPQITRTSDSRNQLSLSDYFVPSLTMALFFLLRPLSYIYPEYAANMFCIKDI